MKRVYAGLLVLGLASCSEVNRSLDEQEVQNLISRHFVENPGDLQVALDRLAAVQKDKREKTYRHAINEASIPNDALSHQTIFGDPTAKRSLIMFSDYNCSICKKANSFLYSHPSIKEGRVKIIVKELPILSSSSTDIASLALVAAKKNVYAAFHYQISQLKKPSASEARSYLMSLKIPDQDLQTHLRSREIELHLKRNAELARKLDVTGTPTFILDGEIIRGWDEKQISKFLSQT
jgi:protein-disulfide isomerase